MQIEIFLMLERLKKEIIHLNSQEMNEYEELCLKIHNIKHETIFSLEFKTSVINCYINILTNI
jgi:hypothetical protein